MSSLDAYMCLCGKEVCDCFERDAWTHCYQCKQGAVSCTCNEFIFCPCTDVIREWRKFMETHPAIIHFSEYFGRPCGKYISVNSFGTFYTFCQTRDQANRWIEAMNEMPKSGKIVIRASGKNYITTYEFKGSKVEDFGNKWIATMKSRTLVYVQEMLV